MRVGKLYEFILFIPWAIAMCLAGMVLSPDMFFCRNLVSAVLPEEHRGQQETVAKIVLLAGTIAIAAAVGVVEAFFDTQRRHPK